MSIREPDTFDTYAENDANLTRSKPASKSGSNKPARLATRTQWALRDMLNEAKKARVEMEEILAWVKAERLDAKGRYDLARLNRLGELSHMVAELALSVAELERKAADARIGVYNPEPPERN